MIFFKYIFINMFNPKTQKIKLLSNKLINRINELENILDKDTNIYIDYANILSWHDRLHFHIDLKRFFQFFKSFSNIKNLYFYYWTLEWDENSSKLIVDMNNLWFNVKTKSVKIMKKSIDVSSIDLSSPAILENFIRKSLLREFKVSTIEYLNQRLKELNQTWKLYIEDRKCNFDVEIWNQMFEDMKSWIVKNFILLSWDSDFYDIIEQLCINSNKVYIFSTAGKVSKELNESKAIVYDLKKIRDFICWNKEIKTIFE